MIVSPGHETILSDAAPRNIEALFHAARDA